MFSKCQSFHCVVFVLFVFFFFYVLIKYTGEKERKKLSEPTVPVAVHCLPCKSPDLTREI